MKIILATTGQPSTNPRLVKEANALVEAGHIVKVYYSFWTEWAVETDNRLLQDVKWDYELIGGSPYKNRIAFILNKISFKFYIKISKYFDFFLAESRNKIYRTLLIALKKEKADHYIAHNLGALAPIAIAANFQHTSFSFDAEDFHRGQYPISCRDQEIDILLEDKYIPKAKFVTTASPLINKHYKNLYPSQNFITINNVFSKDEFQSSISTNHFASLKLVWFSQTIGLNRGLENIINALNKIKDFSIEINLIGNYSHTTQYFFQSLLSEKRHKILFFEPMLSKELHAKLSNFDIGIASETSRDLNNDIALSNKIFSYIQAGLAILASTTSSQKLLLKKYPNIGALIDITDPIQIADQLTIWQNQREKLHLTKKNSLLVAEKLNWENEKKKIINLLNDE